jgi:uncharacterized phage protein (TIGR02216 family)
MAIGLGVLGVASRDFWAMTPREFEAALQGRTGATGALTPPTRGDLDGLMLRFPD